MPIDVVLIGGPAAVLESLRQALRRRSWRIRPCATLREAERVIQESKECIILSAPALADGTWRDVLAHVNGDPARPVIVFNPLAEEQLWLDVLEAGGHDFVLCPFEEREIVHVVSTAVARQRPRTSVQ